MLFNVDDNDNNPPPTNFVGFGFVSGKKPKANDFGVDFFANIFNEEQKSTTLSENVGEKENIDKSPEPRNVEDEWINLNDAQSDYKPDTYVPKGSPPLRIEEENFETLFNSPSLSSQKFASSTPMVQKPRRLLFDLNTEDTPPEKTPKKTFKWGYLYRKKMKQRQRLHLLPANSTTNDEITWLNAVDYRFNMRLFYPKCRTNAKTNSVKLLDSVEIKVKFNRTSGFEEFEEAFLYGVNSKLLPEKWLENHFRLIVWKLWQYEKTHEGKFLVPNNLMTQLRYRYDIEFGAEKKSCFHRILEKEIEPRQRMVFAVLHIKNIIGPINEIYITDGWYSMRADFDIELTAKLRAGRIKVGTKLVTCCSEVKFSNKSPCHPSEVNKPCWKKNHTFF